MMLTLLNDNDIFGFIRPQVDAHTLGITVIANLLEECGYSVFIGDTAIAEAVDNIRKLDHISLLSQWIRRNRITRLGFSYRLDPGAAQLTFGRVFHLLKENHHFQDQGGELRQVYFAGLPEACARIEQEYNGLVPVFVGDETPIETLIRLGVPEHRIPSKVTDGSVYDHDRNLFAAEVIQGGKHNIYPPPVKGGYSAYGTNHDTLAARIAHYRLQQRPPLIRVHVGPYQPNYLEAKKEFNAWLQQLSATGYLDIVSIGSSQLSQSDFGTEWGDKPNGGGVPINSPQDLTDIRAAAHPMLVRTYAGTRNIPALARIYEETLNIAWHALSFWWFNQIDGRGPYGVKENLEQHLETLRFIATTGKPFEPNIPHHFAFRGGDDCTYVLSGYLAAITAKRMGIKHLVLQTMLNTPKYTWGIQDLAKARALLHLVRELEDHHFRVYLQPRAGLDYFSPDLDKARMQLASVTALMDDIEPGTWQSPDIIHVVSYSEAVQLATPEIINESIQITLHTLEEYRRRKKAGKMDDMVHHREVQHRTEELIHQAKAIRGLIEQHLPNPYTAKGLYTIFQKGILPVPYLWEGREEFHQAVQWNTTLVNGGVQLINNQGLPVDPVKRVSLLLETTH